MNQKVTIRDIAKISGVSVSTVSRVVSGKVHVNSDTKAKVLKAIEETGYEPNYTAKALATQSTDTIGVIIDRTPTMTLRNSFFVEVLDSIATCLGKYKKDLILVFSNTEEEENEKVIRLISSKKIDGVIKLSVQKNDPTIKYLVKKEVPTVIIGRPESEDQTVMWVNNDNVKSSKDATNYLISKNLKNFAFVGGGLEYIVTVDRKKGFSEALDEANISYQESDFYYKDFTIQSGYEIADELINKNYDAILCTDDLIAYGISKRLEEQNKYIDIVSFNKTFFSETSPIPFSVMDIKASEMGIKAVELLLNKKERNIIVESELISRS